MPKVRLVSREVFGVRKRCLVAFLVILAPHVLNADSWLPFGPLQASSSNGKTYVIVELVEGRTTFEICARKEGRPPLELPENPMHYDAGAARPQREEGDLLIAGGVLPHPPIDLAVTDDGTMVAFETYRGIGRGNCVTVVTPDGKIASQVRLRDLFSESAIRSFPRTTLSIHWYRTWFVDPRGRLVVVVGVPTLMRAVSLEDGRVFEPPGEVLLDQIRSAVGEKREEALGAAIDARVPGIEALCAEIVNDTSVPVSLRLRAGLASERLRSAPAVQELFRTCVKGAESGRDRAFAIGHLAGVLGEEAIPILREAYPSRRHRQLGKWGFRLLCERVEDERETGDARAAAAHTLAEIGSKDALPALLKAVEDPIEYVASAAVNAAVRIDAEEIRPALIEILSRGSTQDHRIAAYLEQRPGKDAVAALILALERATRPAIASRTQEHPSGHQSARERILRALRSATGEDFGDDPAAWRAGIQE